jgi:hypothetical protein
MHIFDLPKPLIDFSYFINTVLRMLVQVIGWVGALLLIISYLLISFGMLNATNPRFQLLNISGALLLGFSSIMLGAWFSVGLNIFWIAIALVALSTNKKNS